MKKTQKPPSTLTAQIAHEKSAELEILVDAGPVCVCPVWDWTRGQKVQGIWFIYIKSFGMHVGPYYASLVLARDHASKLMKEFPQKSFWEQPLSWFRRQVGFHDWVDKNLGKPEDLIGGEWAPDEKKKDSKKEGK